MGFSHPCRQNTGGTTGLSQNFAKLMQAAGIEREEIRERQGIKGRVVHALSYHSLRHTMNSILANEGVSQELRQSIVGHASKTINSHYTHLEFSTMQSVIAKLPTIG